MILNQAAKPLDVEGTRLHVRPLNAAAYAAFMDARAAGDTDVKCAAIVAKHLVNEFKDWTIDDVMEKCTATGLSALLEHVMKDLTDSKKNLGTISTVDSSAA